MPADLPDPVSTASAANAGHAGRGAPGVHSARAPRAVSRTGRCISKPFFCNVLHKFQQKRIAFPILSDPV